MASSLPSVSEADAAFDARWNAWVSEVRVRDIAAHRSLRVGVLGLIVLAGLAFTGFVLSGGAR